ncbi:hypothetical protein GUJ93_ZPchr0012g21016 [Zizania palustris]|uniref:Uncharacterized protein n=1 Tax=Zizania palustris TaxID=103762 RepID=A0A8J5WPA4_ZIZPA|nr:hypothetical protein GUJ93_ZPchr0012g21016 [Zizania palustris]
MVIWMISGPKFPRATLTLTLSIPGERKKRVLFRGCFSPFVAAGSVSHSQAQPVVASRRSGRWSPPTRRHGRGLSLAHPRAASAGVAGGLLAQARPRAPPAGTAISRRTEQLPHQARPLHHLPLRPTLQDIPKVKKFRSKPFPLFDSMEKLYEGSIATGELNFTSIETIDLPPPSQNECVNLDNPPEVSENPFLTNLDGQRESNNTINLDEEEHRTSSCSGHKGASYGKRESKIRLLEFYKKLLDEEKALATNIFKCELNREIFINFKNPNIRLLWIKGEIASKV